MAVLELVDDGEELGYRCEIILRAALPSSRPARPSLRFSSTVSSAKRRRPSGTSAIPLRAIDSGLRPRSDLSPKTMSPARGGTSPMIACSVVDLPAPFGPISPTISPGGYRERKPADGGDASVRDFDVASSSVRSFMSRLAHSAFAQVRGGHIQVASNLARRSLRQSPPLVEHLDAIADVHDQRHVVIDEENARVVLVANRSHDLGKGRHLGLRQARGGLVHEDEPRRGREGTGDAETPLVPVRERACWSIRVRREVQRPE